VSTRGRSLSAVLGVVLFGVAGLVLAGPAAGVPAEAGPAATATAGTLANDHVGECAATPPEDLSDPDANTSEVVGWVEGYWYTEAVSVTPADGFNRTELRRLTRRTAARVETLRCKTFDAVPPLETVSRDEYQQDLEQSFDEEVTAEGALYENAQMATRLAVGQNEDAIQEQIRVQASAPAAFYDTEEEFMAFVTNSSTVEQLDETILAHELTHALQDDHFELAVVFEQPTNDRYLSSAGVVEGDADLIQSRYRENCGGGWSSECIIPAAGEPPEVPNWNLLLNQLSVYHMPLVEDTYDISGLESVNALFGDWPETTTETINPELYNSFEAANVTVADQSAENWRRVQSGNRTANTVGQAGMTAMFMGPSFASQFQNHVVDNPQAFVEEVTQTGQSFDYGIPETSGWQGDSLYGYANGENQTGGVWVTSWANATAASNFAGTYEALAQNTGASLADGYENVYTFPDNDEYEMAVAIEADGGRVTIVTAPNVDSLTAVHESITLQEASDDDQSDDGTDDSADDMGDDGSADGDSGGDDSGPGFGALAAVVAVVGLALVARTYRE